MDADSKSSSSLRSFFQLLLNFHFLSNFTKLLLICRYADRAKRIVNKAVVNEDPNARIIRELREEVEKLQMQLKQSKVSFSNKKKSL